MIPIPRHLVITGASSGIGAALAVEYAVPGRVLGLLGRNAERLEAVALQCRSRGAATITGLVDLTDEAATAAWLERFDDAHPVDLLIANAGISGGTAGGSETPENIRAIFAANWDGLCNSLFPLIDRMKRRGGGQLALMASLAGYRGFPGAPAYCASKAAVKIFGEGMRGHLHPSGIKVSVICPGFIRTPMTAVNPYRMPFMIGADKAAVIIRRGLEKDKPRIAFPLRAAATMWFFALIPPRLSDLLFRRLPEKPPRDTATG